jgi:tRNA-2-methylthio-N6-dimethylallyladenosine synthase
MKETKYIYIYTIGCQMNVYDSDQIALQLAPMGYRRTTEIDRADLIIANTCTIREKAEQKGFSFLGRLNKKKKRKPGLIVGIGGCVAQQEGRQILKRMPHVDLVFGTQAIGRLPVMIAKIEQTRCRLVDVATSERLAPEEYITQSLDQVPVSTFVTIMRGCDNYCTYCVVPYVRGHEASRSPQEIVAEIAGLTAKGAREVTLLGQNVNSYGQKEGLESFACLLTRISAIQGLQRIRFTTSHPKDISEELIAAFKDLDKLCHHIHLPVQSGSDRILKKMNRKYTSERYLERVAKLRRVCPQIAITSDIIVGFPGESEADFEKTLELIGTVRFDGLFAFNYSDRPNAPAAQFAGKLTPRIKSERLQRVLALQDRIGMEKNRELIGKCVTVLVEGASKHQTRSDHGAGGNPDHGMLDSHDEMVIQWTGRTSGNKIVNFGLDQSQSEPNQDLTGQMVDVIIEKSMAHSLWGRPEFIPSPSSHGVKGDKSYAA